MVVFGSQKPNLLSTIPGWIDGWLAGWLNDVQPSGAALTRTQPLTSRGLTASLAASVHRGEGSNEHLIAPLNYTGKDYGMRPPPPPLRVLYYYSAQQANDLGPFAMFTVQ